MKKRINQAAIAQKLQLSVATISKCLSGDPLVSSVTRERVLVVAREMGYRPVGTRIYPQAEELTVRTLCYLTWAGGESQSYFSALPMHQYMAGLSQTAQELNCNLVFHQLPATESYSEADLPPMMRNGGVDGLILSYGVPRVTASALAQRFPCVCTGERFAGVPADFVCHETQAALQRLVEELVNSGHRRIAFFGNSFEYSWARNRMAAYIAALSGFELPLDFDRILTFERSSGLCSICERAVAMTRTGQVSAWVCANDGLGYELLRAFAQAGISVGEDVAVTGFDGGEVPPGLPQLTTVRVSLPELARTAVRQVCERIRNPCSPHITIGIDCPFVPGATVCRS